MGSPSPEMILNLILIKFNKSTKTICFRFLFLGIMAQMQAVVQACGHDSRSQILENFETQRCERKAQYTEKLLK